MRRTIITGNGLGMALDPVYFSLNRAIASVWDDPECLSRIQKQLITECLTRQGVGEMPQGEEDLDILHRVVLACQYLLRIGRGDIHWLSDHGSEFPDAIKKFITAVAWYFHYHEHILPCNFVESISGYIQETKSHIATLNYDNLLYQNLIERGVLRGYDSALVDGFHRISGFSCGNLDRKYGRDFGYYLHLHGSPLFIEANAGILKQKQGNAREIPTPHLVLTHVEHKPSVIDSSVLLKTYWCYLDHAIRESEKIIIIGYSGLDDHLNRFIKALCGEKEISIIEWNGAGEREERIAFWSDKLGGKAELMRLDNILDYDDWEN